jgi:lysozyme
MKMTKNSNRPEYAALNTICTYAKIIGLAGLTYWLISAAVFPMMHAKELPVQDAHIIEFEDSELLQSRAVVELIELGANLPATDGEPSSAIMYPTPAKTVEQPQAQELSYLEKIRPVQKPIYWKNGKPQKQFLKPTYAHKGEAISIVINGDGLDIIRQTEGLHLRAYKCPAGYPTIGYGHRIKKGEHFGRISKAAAEKLLRKDFAEKRAELESLVKRPLSRHQAVAITSIVYNTGVSKLKGSGLIKALKQGNDMQVAVELNKWVYAKGKKLRGLEYRRIVEATLFLTGKTLQLAELQ